MVRQQLPPQIEKITLADGSIRYQLIVDVGADPDTGKQRQVRRRFEKAEDAKRALTETSGKVARGEFVPRKAFSVDELCADWLASLHGLRATTIAGYEYDLASLWEAHATMPVQRLTRRHIDDLVTELSNGGTKTAKGSVRKPWVARSLNRTIDTTAMALEYGVDRRLIGSNVAEKVKRLSKARKEMSTYTPDEVAKVLQAADGDRDGHLWYLALSGLRRGEVGGLRWSDVDQVEKTLTVRMSRVAAAGKVVENGPKTNASSRTLPLDEGLAAVLRAAHKRQAEDRLALGPAYGAEDYVACDEAGRPYHPDTLNKRWSRLGHADASVTARIYAHSQLDALTAASVTLGGVVTSTVTNTEIATETK
jgi:integrase